ncbi:MAG: metal-dependent transcriptional regulator [Chloroflexia bacterium]|nr:metal-dependent transcriptional regulator [Chloroflexia bacterium]
MGDVGAVSRSVGADGPRVTPAITAYLRAVYVLREEGSPVATQRIARELGVSGPSVTNMVKRLHALGLLRHARYHGVALTEAGERVALLATRRHRLLELYLVEALGYRWDEVHAEAERLAHDASEELAARIEAALGHPTFDPHGDPIPSREGIVAPVADRRLLDLEPGATATVCRVSDRNPAQLRYLGKLGFAPGVTVAVLDLLPFDGPVHVRVGSTQRVISRFLAAAVSVEGRGADRAAGDEGVARRHQDRGLG